MAAATRPAKAAKQMAAMIAGECVNTTRRIFAPLPWRRVPVIRGAGAGDGQRMPAQGSLASFFGLLAERLLIPAQWRNRVHPQTAAWGQLQTHASQQTASF